MRVAQSFAGYSLEEADNLRKAAGKKIREVMAMERDEVRRRLRAHRATAPSSGTAAVRHHRAVRRLRLQQVPLLRLRLRRLPDRVPQGALPDRVPRRAADQRQGRQGQDRGLPGRVPAMGIEVQVPDVNRSVVGLHRPTVARAGEVPGSSRSACRPCATSARASSPRSSPSGTSSGPFTDFYDFCAAGRPDGAQQADHRVADQGRRLRLARPPPPGPAPGASSRSSTGPWPAGASATGRDEPVRRRRAATSRSSTTPGSRSPTSSSTRRSSWRSRRRCSGLYVSDHPLMGAEAALRRRDRRARIAELRGRRGRRRRAWVGGVVTSLDRK